MFGCTPSGARTATGNDAQHCALPTQVKPITDGENRPHITAVNSVTQPPLRVTTTRNPTSSDDKRVSWGLALVTGKAPGCPAVHGGGNGVTYVGCLARWPTPKSGRGKRVLHQPGVVTSDSGRFPTHAPGLRHAIQRLTGALAPGSAVDQLARRALTDVEDAWQRTQKVQAIHVALLASDREIANRGRWRRLTCPHKIRDRVRVDPAARIRSAAPHQTVNKIRLYRQLTADEHPAGRLPGRVPGWPAALSAAIRAARPLAAAPGSSLRVRPAWSRRN
jgi:hypothetical protein